MRRPWQISLCEKGGRGDDGTDRPALLQALMLRGENVPLGFSYAGDGLQE